MTKYKILLLSLFLIIMTFASCDMDSGSDTDEETKPIYTLQLEDGGEVKFYEDEPGDLVTIITSKSVETIKKLDDKNCIEIYQELREGVVPQVLQDAYARSLQNTTDDEEAVSGDIVNDEIQTDTDTAMSTKASKYIKHHYNPNWDFWTFRNQVRYIAGMAPKKDGEVYFNIYNLFKLTEYPNRTGYARLERRCYSIKAFAYCYRGQIVFRIKQAKGRYRVGKWVSRGYGKVGKGRWAYIKADGKLHYYRVYVQDADGDGFHLMCYSDVR